jgi:hypothetical protein
MTTSLTKLTSCRSARTTPAFLAQCKAGANRLTETLCLRVDADDVSGDVSGDSSAAAARRPGFLSSGIDLLDAHLRTPRGSQIFAAELLSCWCYTRARRDSGFLLGQARCISTPRLRSKVPHLRAALASWMLEILPPHPDGPMARRMNLIAMVVGRKLPAFLQVSINDFLVPRLRLLPNTNNLPQSTVQPSFVNNIDAMTLPERARILSILLVHLCAAGEMEELAASFCLEFLHRCDREGHGADDTEDHADFKSQLIMFSAKVLTSLVKQAIDSGVRLTPMQISACDELRAVVARSGDSLSGSAAFFAWDFNKAMQRWEALLSQ